MRLIAIVLGEENSKIRNSESMALLDYGFMNTKFNLLKKSGQVVEKIKLDKSNRSMVDVSLKNDLGVVELVDAIGGIYVDVPVTIEEQDSNRQFGEHLITVEEGYQHLNGEQALALSRHRKTLAKGDLGRAEHQQL